MIPRGPSLPPLPKRNPGVQMKGLFWTKLPNRSVSDTIWIKMNIAKDTAEITINTKELEELFSAKKATQIAVATATTEEDKKKAQTVTLVDAKRAQNCAILLGSMRIDPEEIKNYILALDETKLIPQMVVSLRDQSPTPEELQAINEYTGDPNLLGQTEKFYKVVQIIPNMQGRLTAWIYKLKFFGGVADLQPDLGALLEACKEIMTSNKWMKILQLLLSLGNFLNGKTNRGDTYGFKIETLKKIPDMKSADNKSNLLQYIATFMDKQYPDLLTIMETETSHVEKASKVSPNNLQAEISELRKGLENVWLQVDNAEKQPPVPGDRFIEVMRNFAEVASMEVQKLDDNLAQLKSDLEKVAQLYGEDPAQFSSEEFFGTIAGFLKSLKDANEDYKKRVAEEEAKRRKDEAAAARKAKLMGGRQGQKESSSAAESEESSAADEIDKELEGISQGLADGTAFRNQRRIRRRRAADE